MLPKREQILDREHLRLLGIGHYIAGGIAIAFPIAARRTRSGSGWTSRNVSCGRASTGQAPGRSPIMETRLILRPGQPGTKKLAMRYGERLLRVRYRYDEKEGRRLKTVELIVESVPWRPAQRRPRRRDDEIVAVPIAYGETDLRERAKRLGAIWRPAQRIWEMTWLDAKRLGIADRVSSDI